MRNSDMPAMPLAEPELWADGCGNSKAIVEAHGLTKREYFSGLALQGLLASGPHDCDERGLAHDAVLFSDALLAELEKDAEK